MTLAAQEEAPLETTHAEGDLVAGKVRLVRQLGRGGMAEVWLGTHETLRIEVAVKFVLAEHLTHEEQAAAVADRFRFEAQVSAQLSLKTKHIVSVVDAGIEPDGTPFSIMEFVPGQTLEDEILKGPVPLERLATILDHIGEALEAAHKIGVVHRDVKPSNVMVVDSRGEPFAKLADFGVAKAFRAMTLDSPKRTRFGSLVGSPGYMSPEQILATGDLSPASDLFNLGVLAFEALTKDLPFEDAATPEAMALAVAVSPHKTLRSFRPELPAALDAWMDRALAKAPEQRFSSPLEMTNAFREAIRPKPKTATRKVAIVAAAIVGAAIVTAVSFRSARVPQQPAPVASASVAATAEPTVAPTAVASAAAIVTSEPTAVATTVPAATMVPTVAPKATAKATVTARPVTKKKFDPSDVQ